MMLRFVILVALLVAGFGCAETSETENVRDAQVANASPDSGDAGNQAEPTDAGIKNDEDSGVSDSGADEVDAGVIYPDAETFPDAEISDTGPSPQSRCRVTYSGLVQYADYEPLIPMNHSWIYQASLSRDLKHMYLTVLLPHSTESGWLSDDIYVLTRTGTSGPFTSSQRANLDVDSVFGNESNERDFSYVPSLDRFFYVEATAGGNRSQIVNTIMSVRQPNPMTPEFFDDFLVESLNLDEVDQTANFRMPSLTNDGLVMVATLQPRFGSEPDNLYEFRRSSLTDGFQPAQRLSISSDLADDYYPWLSEDGLQLIFTSNRDPLGNKLYCSWRNGLDQPWQGPIPYGQIPEANVQTHDFSASLVGGELYFVRVYPGERRSEFVRAVR